MEFLERIKSFFRRKRNQEPLPAVVEEVVGTDLVKIAGKNYLPVSAALAADEILKKADRAVRSEALDREAAETLAKLKRIRREQQAHSLMATVEEEADYLKGRGVYGKKKP